MSLNQLKDKVSGVIFTQKASSRPILNSYASV